MLTETLTLFASMDKSIPTEDGSFSEITLPKHFEQKETEKETQNDTQKEIELTTQPIDVKNDESDCIEKMVIHVDAFSKEEEDDEFDEDEDADDFDYVPDVDYLEQNYEASQFDLEYQEKCTGIKGDELKKSIRKQKEEIRKKKEYKCTYEGCEAVFYRPDRLRIHISNKHTFFRRYKCPVESCSESFACQNYLTRHLNRHKRRLQILASSLVEPVLDNQDSNSSSNASLGSFKELPPLTRPPKFYVCNLCSEKFKRKYLLRIHRAEAHGEKMQYECSVCSKSFVLEYKLKIHAKIHNERKNCCTYPGCGFHTDKWSLLRKHVATEHSTMVCQTCGKRFKRNESLRAHMETKHAGKSSDVPRFVCNRPGCSKSYTRETSLRTHQHNSHDEPKFSCAKCQAKFRHRKSLKEHEPRCGSVIAKPKVPPKKAAKAKEPATTKRVLRRKTRSIDPVIYESQFDEIDRLALERADHLTTQPKAQITDAESGCNLNDTLDDNNKANKNSTWQKKLSLPDLAQSNLI